MNDAETGDMMAVMQNYQSRLNLSFIETTGAPACSCEAPSQSSFG